LFLTINAAEAGVERVLGVGQPVLARVPRTPSQHPEKRLLIERIAVGAGRG
jgi:hypothetical protein